MTEESKRPVLLVVEDDEGLQRQLKWAYEAYEVVFASDRSAALDQLRLHEPAVVTLDLGLPPDPDGTAEGFATLTEILRIKPDTKVIVASGHGARESALKAIGAADLDLPGTVEEEPDAINLRAVREVADRRAIRQALSRTENNISGAAKLLGISRPTLYDLLKQYRLQA